MRVSRKQVEENKQTILTAAGRLFRERGFDAVTVTDIMKSAGLTHGGFYGYFKSKDDLIAQTLAELKIENDAAKNDVVAQIERYLSPEHRDNFASGCPAIGSWSAMVGALILARMTADSTFSDEILGETAAWLAEKQR